MATRLDRLLDPADQRGGPERLIGVVGDAARDLQGIGDDDLQAIGRAAARLLADSRRLDYLLASRLGELLPPPALARLRGHSQLLPS